MSTKNLATFDEDDAAEPVERIKLARGDRQAQPIDLCAASRGGGE